MLRPGSLAVYDCTCHAVTRNRRIGLETGPVCGRHNETMLTTLLLGAVDNTEVRTLKVNGILDTQGTTTITRTIKPYGEMSYVIHDNWGKNDTWTETLVQSDASVLLQHSFKWVKPKGNNSLWSTKIVDGTAQWRAEEYEGEAIEGGWRATKLSAGAVGDASLWWWSLVAPKTGDKVERNRFVPMFGYESEVVTYLGDSQLTFGSTSVNTHKVQRNSPTLTLIVWLDDVGMPLRREFYRSGSSSIHRADVWVQK